jgi:hypothetical protein
MMKNIGLRKKHKTLKRGGNRTIKAGDSYIFEITRENDQLTFIAKCLYYNEQTKTVYFIVTTVFVNGNPQPPNSVPSDFYIPLLNATVLIYDSPDEFARSYFFDLNIDNLSQINIPTFKIVDESYSIEFKKK